MEKLIFIDFDKCIGCKTCETACSLTHEGRVNPSESRISVIKTKDQAANIPIMCQKCEEPLCYEVCPMNAITIDPMYGTRINLSLCIGCKLCILNCPVGGVSLNPTNKNVIMCDLCDGEPQCVKFCPENALEYIEASELTQKIRKETINKLYTSQRRMKS